MSVHDDPLELDGAQRDALAGFEREADVFAELGPARVDDAARISAWVERAVTQAGGVGTAAAGASKAWLVGGAVVLVAGAVAVGLLAGPSRELQAPIETPVIAAPVIEAPVIEAPVIETPVVEAPMIEPPVERAPPPSKRARTDRATPSITAADLLRQAATARRDGKKADALELYRRIGREFPRSREDTVAKVAIGRLELDLGHPDRALASFDAYLRERATGNLAEEASFGRASALRALGRGSDERAALRDFIARFPDSVQLERARTRLATLGG